MIARQFAHAPKLSRDLGNYGLEGTVQLCAATALRVYVLAGILIVIVIAIAGISVVAIAVFGLLTLVAAGLTIVRGISADRTGREWRRTKG